VAIGFNEMNASDKALFTAKGLKGFGIGLPQGVDEQLQAYAALVDKQTYARMVAAAKAIAANPSQALSGMVASLKGDTKDALLGVYLSWMQADSQALGELSGKIVGAAIVDTVAATTGIAVVKNSAQIAEGLAKIGSKVSVFTGKELERIAKNALVNSGGVVSWKTGQPLLDMSLLSPTQKGMMGELFGPNTIQKIIPDGLKIGRTPGVGQTGIDDLYKVNRTGVDYVVVEYKFNTSSLGSTADGAQMSDSWLRGDTTKYQRILESVQGDVASATAIRSSMDAGRVEKWVVRTMPDGSTKITVLDAVGQVKNVDTSKILIPKNNPYGVKYE
jgi:filamentous hemagglutinin